MFARTRSLLIQAAFPGKRVVTRDSLAHVGQHPGPRRSVCELGLGRRYQLRLRSMRLTHAYRSDPHGQLQRRGVRETGQAVAPVRPRANEHHTAARTCP